MTNTTFIDKVTVVKTDWLNDINKLHYVLLEGPNTVQDIKDVLGGGSPHLLAFKSNDTTKINDTTLTSDPDLFVPVNANTFYSIEVYLFCSGDEGNGLKAGYFIPTGSTANASISYFNDDDEEYVIKEEVIPPNTITIDLFEDTEVSIYYTGFLFTGSTSGDFSIAWRQDNFGSEEVTVRKGSWLKLTEFA